MFAIWVIFHVAICTGLVLVVLMQSSKGEGLAGTALGGGGGMAGAVFGGRGAASFLSKATTILAILFMLNCGALAFMSASTRITIPGASPSSAPTSSAVTREAQKERDRFLQQQQQRVDDSVVTSPFQISPVSGDPDAASNIQFRQVSPDSVPDAVKAKVLGEGAGGN